MLSETRGEVIAELPSNPADGVYLALPAGDYRIVRRALGDVRERTLALASGSTTELDPSTMTVVAPTDTRSKSDLLQLRSRLGVYAGLSTTVVPGSATMVGMAALAYSYDFRRVVLRARASFTSFDAQQEGYSSSFVRGAAISTSWCRSCVVPCGA